MTTLADQLAAAKSIADIERALAGAERRTVSFVELMREPLDDPFIALIVDKHPTLGTLAEQRNVLTWPVLHDAVRRVTRQ